MINMKLDNFFDIETDFNFDKERESFIENLDMLKSMSVQESTLYKKGCASVGPQGAHSLRSGNYCISINLVNVSLHSPTLQ